MGGVGLGGEGRVGRGWVGRGGWGGAGWGGRGWVGRVGLGGKGEGLGAEGGAGWERGGAGWGVGGDLLTSPLNLALLALCAYLLVKIVRGSGGGGGGGDGAGGDGGGEEPLARLKRRDFNVEQLREFDGVRSPRILMAVNGKVFDVTEGRRFYGPEGPYGVFAGRDASRGLATFCLDRDALKDAYDDLSDMSPTEMESVHEWEMQFTEKYHHVGRLLKPGEEPNEYSDTESSSERTKDD
ncbi:unnamed protein product [Lampetra planeri]